MQNIGMDMAELNLKIHKMNEHTKFRQNRSSFRADIAQKPTADQNQGRN